MLSDDMLKFVFVYDALMRKAKSRYDMDAVGVRVEIISL